ncbi:MAG: flavodoxin-dependent (E)-4-hydroxy-3-methylbut-2-enyl-diphosphate synthase [Planctomycetota bacterium]
MKTRKMWIGKVPVGGGAPVSVQTMTKTPTENIKSTVRQIHELEELGCQVIRFAIPRLSSAQAIAPIKKQIHIPIEADIHFNPKLALESIKSGADSIRLNPGNITDKEAIKEIAKQAKARHIPIRVGVNSGSVSGWAKRSANTRPDVAYAHRDNVAVRHFVPTATNKKLSVWEKMVQAAVTYSRYLETLKFRDIMVSLKASDVPSTVKAYRKISKLCDYPLHLGVTAAGPLEDSIVKSAIGIGSLLLDGIGDTIRVSITGTPHDEVRAAYQILEAVGLRKPKLEIISCPTCGRCEIDVVKYVTEFKKQINSNPGHIKRLNRPIKVAIMGCVVNGPGEAKEADIGVAGGSGFAFLFKHGRKISRIPPGKIIPTLLHEINKI